MGFNSGFKGLIQGKCAAVCSYSNVSWKENNQSCPNNYFKFNYIGLWPGWSDPSGRAVLGVGLRSLDCWDCGFESRRRHRCLSLVIVVYCQVDVCASCWSLVQGSTTDCDVSECDREASTMRSSWPSKV